MTLTSDLEVLKDIPGYKPILKAVLKSQIQFLVEQLSDHTGEESVLLTASVAEGSLSHLGSNTGRHFIEGHDDVKAMFLTYCLKNGQMDDDDMPVKTKTTPSRLIALAKRSPATPGTSSIQPDNRKRKPGAPIVVETSSPKTMKLAPTGDYPGEDDGDDHVELEEDEGDQGSGEGATGPATQTKRTAKPFSVFRVDTDDEDEYTPVFVKQEPDSDVISDGVDIDINQFLTSVPYESETSVDDTGLDKDDNESPSVQSSYEDAGTQRRKKTRCTVPMVYYSGTHPFGCTICGRSFRQKHHVSSHMRTHTGERPFTCHYCDRRFSQKGAMHVHERRHTGERPFSCSTCGMTFADNSHYYQHRKRTNHDYIRPSKPSTGSLA